MCLLCIAPSSIKVYFLDYILVYEVVHKHKRKSLTTTSKKETTKKKMAKIQHEKRRKKYLKNLRRAGLKLEMVNTKFLLYSTGGLF